MKKVLLIGSKSQLSKAIEKILKKKKYKILKISRSNIDFRKNNSSKLLFKFLNKTEPDYIINCIGIFESNNSDFSKIFNVNCKPSWDLVKYFINNMNKKVKIMFVGSSAHNQKRKNYILYTASKASLNSIAKSAMELFKNTLIEINIIHPPAMKSKMRKKFFMKNTSLKSKSTEVKPKIVADKILKKLKI